MANRVTKFFGDWPTGDNAPEADGPRFEASYSSFYVCKVCADATGRAVCPSDPCFVDAEIEQCFADDGTTYGVYLNIDTNRPFSGLGEESGRLMIKNRNGLDALIRALLELRRNPFGLRILQSIPAKGLDTPSPSTERPDDDDDGDEWKQGAVQ